EECRNSYDVCHHAFHPPEVHQRGNKQDCHDAKRQISKSIRWCPTQHRPSKSLHYTCHGVEVIQHGSPPRQVIDNRLAGISDWRGIQTELHQERYYMLEIPVTDGECAEPNA